MVLELMNQPSMKDVEAALRLFDETTRALDARSRRLEEVLSAKQQELLQANERLQTQLTEVDRLSTYLNMIMASASSGVLAVNADGMITMCNPAALQFLSGIIEDPVEANYAEIFSESPLLEILRGEADEQQYERKMRQADGSMRLFSLKACPMRDNDGRLLGAVETFDDITEVQRLREEHERDKRLRALGEMAAGVAHEIRNPLNGIEGFASLLQRDLPESASSQKYVGSIIDGVHHLNRTVTDLLAYTRPRMPERRKIPLVELLESCKEFLAVEYADSEHSPQLVLALPDDEQFCHCDGTQLRQVLLNLLQNAAQACGDEAVIRITLKLVQRRGEDYYAISIEDNGPGIPESERDQIFTPFFTTKDNGTGLGLAISHHLIELHGGKLSVREGEELGGACFELVLPIE